MAIDHPACNACGRTDVHAVDCPVLRRQVGLAARWAVAALVALGMVFATQSWDLGELAFITAGLLTGVAVAYARHQLRDRDIEFRSLTEGFDTSSSGGRLVFHVFAAVAEFERQLIRERTMAGLEAAKREGRTGGRPSVMTTGRLEASRLMHQDGHSLRDIATALDVSPSTVGRHLRAIRAEATDNEE